MSPAVLETEQRLFVSARVPAPAALSTHLSFHGPLHLPPRDDPAWRAQMGRAVAESGLFGRGGGGFPAGAKWDATCRTGRRSLVVVNAMEGEPASVKDRFLLTRAPHLVLDGAEVAASVLGAPEIAVCVPDHAGEAASAVSEALFERRRAGMSRRRVSIERPPGRYVAGEESALAEWLAGRPSLPVFRPDKSVPLAVGRRPLLVHNAETLAHVALIARHGPRWFCRAGAPDAPGTTLVTVSGAVRSAGVVEVELGRPVGEIVARAGVDGEVGAVLVGGYGGAWIPAGCLDTPYSPAGLGALGAPLGAGVLVVLPASSCGIAETARLVHYLAGESAGQCGPCVFGLPALAGDMALLVEGRDGPGVGLRLARRLDQIAGRGACRHPDGAVRLVRSALRTFAADARRHAEGRPCQGVHEATVLTFPAFPAPMGRGR